MIALIYIVTIAVMLFVLISTGLLIAAKLDSSKTKKQIIVPKNAFPQAGICQCDDALCYHAQGPCSVRNCPCKAFVPSAITDDDLNTIAAGTMFRLLGEAADAKSRYEVKQRELQRSIDSNRY